MRAVHSRQISHNRSLDGVLDELHSGKLTEAGSLDMLDASDSDGERHAPGSNLPGELKRMLENCMYLDTRNT